MAPTKERALRYSTPEESSNSNNRCTRNEDAKLKREWDTPRRVRVKIYQECGNTRNTIKQKTNVPISTQKAISKGPDRRPGLNRPGAAKKIDERTLRQMIRFVSKSHESRTSTWQDLADAYTEGVHWRTVKNHMNSAGYHKCKACQRSWLREDNVTARKVYASIYKKRPQRWWRRVRFTDEVHFAVESQRAEYVIRNSEERFCQTCFQYKKKQTGSQLHCWAMVGWNYKSPEIVFYDSNDHSKPTEWLHQALNTEGQDPAPVQQTEDEERQLLGDAQPSTCKCRCKNKLACKHACCKPGYRSPKTGGNLTQVQYLTKIFHPHIEPAWQEAKAGHHAFVLLEDNDGSHGTRTRTNLVARYKALLERHGFHWYANTAQSPDLNIIENVWRILKQRVKSHTCRSIKELKEAIQQEWKAISQSEINELVETMPERLEECFKRGGLHTGW